MLGLYVATSKLSAFGVSMSTADEDREILVGQLQLYLVSCAIPLLWFGLVFLRRSRFLKVWWLLLFMCIFQWVFARACVFFIEKLSGHWNYEGTAEVYPTFAEVRHGLSVFESMIYAPALYLVEHGYGMLALVLHSLVLGGIVTGILYALVRIYRMWRRPPAADETELELLGCDN
ncbi:MAG: hypothetical protein IT365_25215 [Candidatus Hydrogenedentes bacterium]|nr:hypothetical protein [Candidatus Hydrogenedentota bacterium]